MTEDNIAVGFTVEEISCRIKLGIQKGPCLILRRSDGGLIYLADIVGAFFKLTPTDILDDENVLAVRLTINERKLVIERLEGGEA